MLHPRIVVICIMYISAAFSLAFCGVYSQDHFLFPTDYCNLRPAILPHCKKKPRKFELLFLSYLSVQPWQPFYRLLLNCSLKQLQLKLNYHATSTKRCGVNGTHHDGVCSGCYLERAAWLRVVEDGVLAASLSQTLRDWLSSALPPHYIPSLAQLSTSNFQSRSRLFLIFS